MFGQLIGGVDFSGAKTVPNNTWLAIARMDEEVNLVDLKKVGSHALGAELSAKPALRAVGIDCPFSVPVAFLQFLASKLLRPPFESWREIAEALVMLSVDQFVDFVKEYKREPKRFTDGRTAVPAISPLHRGNPSMVQMTFYGIRLFATLDPSRFFALPFQDEIKDGCAVIEVYPRALLKFLQLPDTGYKGDDDSAQSARKKVLEGLLNLRSSRGLSYRDCPELVVQEVHKKLMLESDHALDAVLACYTTALFQKRPALFADPFAADNEAILLEGWIYEPRRA